MAGYSVVLITYVLLARREIYMQLERHTIITESAFEYSVLFTHTVELSVGVIRTSSFLQYSSSTPTSRLTARDRDEGNS